MKGIIRKIVIGKEYTKDAMSYSVGQPVYRGQYKIDSIIKEENGEITINIEKDNDTYYWKTINPHVAFILEYSLDFVGKHEKSI